MFFHVHLTSKSYSGAFRLVFSLCLTDTPKLKFERVRELTLVSRDLGCPGTSFPENSPSFGLHLVQNGLVRLSKPHNLGILMK